jgi:hypothetical protein
MWLCLCRVFYNVVVYVIVGGASGLCGFLAGVNVYMSLGVM